MVGTDKQNDILMGQGRYASAKKTRSKDVRPVSLVDMQHRRDVESLQKKLYQQHVNVRTVGERAPHINYDIMIHPNSATRSSGQNN